MHDQGFSTPIAVFLLHNLRAIKISSILSWYNIPKCKYNKFYYIFLMSQRFEDSGRHFSVRCSGVGLECDCVISGMNEKFVMDETVRHMFEHHAINPEEMTACMRIKIRENIRESRTFVDRILLAQHTAPRVF